MRTPIPHACERSQERWSTGIVSCTIANVLLEIAFGRCQRGAADGDAMTIVGSERQRASGNSVSAAVERVQRDVAIPFAAIGEVHVPIRARYLDL